MQPLRIVTTGLAGTYPLGGVFWDYLQYPLGLLRLGHDVLYVEDTGKWCYDASAGTFVESGAANAQALARHLEKLDPNLATRWFFRDASGQTFGRPWPEVVDFCRHADLVLHVSASCMLRDEYLTKARVALIDSDPLYTQVSLLSEEAPGEASARLQWWRERHQAFFTFGENIGADDCAVPTGPIRWLPTRQPIVLDCFTPAMAPYRDRRRLLTTVASWEPSEKGPVWQEVAYSGKSTEFLRFIDLPARSAWPVEVALAGPAPRDRLREHGWRLRDAAEISRDPWTYRDYLARSAAEWSVAKNAYVAARTGWFSCRTACYLALGIPAVVQDTGFSKVLPTGEGLLSFRTLDEAAEAIEHLTREPEHHARAARALAEEYFDSRKVLTRLLEEALA